MQSGHSIGSAFEEQGQGEFGPDSTSIVPMAMLRIGIVSTAPQRSACQSAQYSMVPVLLCCARQPCASDQSRALIGSLTLTPRHRLLCCSRRNVVQPNA
jgi:hypothetical protein